MLQFVPPGRRPCGSWAVSGIEPAGGSNHAPVDQRRWIVEGAARRAVSDQPETVIILSIIIAGPEG